MSDSTQNPKRLSEDGGLARLLTAARTDETERVGARERTWTLIAGGPLRILVPALGLIFAAAIAFVALQPEPTPATGPRASSPPETSATLTLVSGDVERARPNDWVPAAIGERLWEGARLRTGNGRAYVRFASAGAFIERGSRLALRRGALALESGAVSLAVRHGTGGLAIEVGDHRVEVMGTVFQVAVAPERNEDAVAVYVHEGEVRVRGPATDVRVRAGESWTSGLGPGTQTMAPADVAAVRSLAIFDRHEAVLAVSQREGAEVIVDGVRLGRAPLAVVQRVGTHEIFAGGRVRRAQLGPDGGTFDLDGPPLPSLTPPAPPPEPLGPGDRDDVPALQRTLVAPGVGPSERDTARHELARTLARRGRHAEALALYSTLAGGEGAWSEVASYEVGRLKLRSLRDAPGAVEAFVAYRVRWPRGARTLEVWLGLIEAQLEKGASREALKEIDLFLAAHPGHARAADVRLVRSKIE